MGLKQSASSSASFEQNKENVPKNNIGNINSVVAEVYDSKFLRSVKRRELTTCQYLLKKKDADPNVVENGQSAIDIAILQHDMDMLRFLINEGCSVDSMNLKHHFPSIFLALMHGNKESIKLLLDNNCQLDIRFEGQTILSVIGSHFTDKKFECMVEILNLIVNKGIDTNMKDYNKETILHLCAKNGHNRCLQYFANIPNQDINAQNNDGSTPLHVGIDSKNYMGVNILLDTNANVNIKDNFGCTPLLTLAKTMGAISKISSTNEPKLLIDGNYYDSDSIIQNVCHLYDKLSFCGCDINICNVSVRGLTALHYAAQQGITKLVKKLLDLGAKHIVETSEGKSPLYLAAAGGHVMAVRCLLEHGANVDQADRSEKIPLHAAVYNDHLDVVEELLFWHADINHVNHQGKTPLFFAAQHGNLDIARYLVKAGANMSICDYEGCTALHEAVSFPRFNVPMVMLLLEQGCDPVNLDIFLHDMLINKIFDYNDFTDLYVWYLENYNRAKTLKQLCRIVIQQTLLVSHPKLSRREAVCALKLPASICNFLSAKML